MKGEGRSITKKGTFGGDDGETVPGWGVTYPQGPDFVTKIDL